MSADYRFSDSRKSERFRSLRGLSGLGTQPSNLGITFFPTALTSRALALATALRSAAADAPMWTLDVQWAPTARWESMKSCITQHNYGGGFDSQPWNNPGLVAAGGCKNWAGTLQPPSCDWGFWRLPTCSLETATSFSFQFSRYFWAQGRMRDHLRNRPVPVGANYTTAAVAADWVWKAAQLISVLLWSTNVRFDSGYGVVRHVGADLVDAGLLLQRSRRATDPRTNTSGHERGVRFLGAYYDKPLPPMPPPMDGTWQSIPRVWEIIPMVYNYLGNDPVAPVDQNGFSPYFGRIWNSTLLRFGPSDSAPMVARPIPGMSDIADDDDLSMLRRWFALNWLGGPPAWVKTPQKVYEGRSTHQAPVPDWTRSERTLWTTSPQWIVNDLAEQLAHYSDPTHTYFDWMNTAVRTFDINTPQDNRTAAGQNFIASKHDLLANVTAAATQAHSLIGSGGTGGDAATGAMIVQTGISLVASIATLILPVVGLFFTAFAAITDFLKNLVIGLIPSGPAPCATFPFIRVMSPDAPCAIEMTDITASLLGVDSNASWPLWTDQIGNKTLALSIDGTIVTTTFTTSDTDANAVARRINAAAALSLPLAHPAVASVRRGQVHVEGTDPSSGQVRVLGGTATILGFVGTRADAGTPPGAPHRLVGRSGPPADDGDVVAPAGGNGLLIGGGLLLAALAAWAATRKKDPAKMEEP